ncbi:MAG: amidase [Gemmatimonadetes bacterium]|nr:amidase [Gemmatimonadota bacterium]
MTSDPCSFGLKEAAQAIARRRLSPSELLAAVRARIAECSHLGAFIDVAGEGAEAQARLIEERLAKRRRVGPLAGVPISVKDLILTADALTTCGSRVFGDGLPAGSDAPVVAAVRGAGAIILGKANLHEVALGVTTVNEHFGPARNPWSPDRVAGGSSGGSAVAVAAGLGPGSIGTDTRGSIRIPAACCGVTGFKPSYGLVSTEGVLPLAATLDHVGPLTRSAEDAAWLLAAMTRRSRLAANFTRAVGRKPPRATIAVIDYFFEQAVPEVADAVAGVVGLLGRQGHKIVRTSLPELEPAMEASRVIVLAEAIAFHDPHLKRNPDGYGPLLRSRLEGGYQLSALQYVKAEEARIALMAGYHQLFREVDFLVAPTLPLAAVPIGTQHVSLEDREISISEAYCRYTAPHNMTGAPAVSVPCGFTSERLPIGVQFVAGLGRDAAVLGLGAAYQRATDWHQRRPKIAGIGK